mmetsp:Transcript_26037/g.62714  ORF Transcript_26037/g.62714 Transcript_26037/m.62714 type:complete len:234 (+) Transcript_26037:410-1111(+)
MEWNMALWHEEHEGTGEFDITASYHPKATIPIPYLCTWDLIRRFGKGKKPMFQRGALKEPAAVAMISNCGAKERKEYMSEMAKYIPISNAGSCHISGVKSERSPPRWGGNWFASKNSVVSRFPFYLAFENSNLTAYVTEKLYTGYFAGVIPVFWGDPSVQNVAPNGSFLDANKFESPKALAMEMKAIAADYDRYKSFFEYLPNGLSDLFDEVCEESLMCRICKTSSKMIRQRQ